MELPRERMGTANPDMEGSSEATVANVAGLEINNVGLRFAGGKCVKRKIKYTDELPRQLYTFFISQCAEGAPSFDKFARSIGATLEEIEHLRKHREFDRAYRECSEIRRDYLIDSALTRRYDPSFVKFLLTAEFGMGEKDKEKEDTGLVVTLEVLGDDVNKT